MNRPLVVGRGCLRAKPLDTAKGFASTLVPPSSQPRCTSVRAASFPPTRRTGSWILAALVTAALSSVKVGAACVAPPPGLVAWWQAEGDALDSAGQAHGILVGDTRYAIGKVGSAFVFDGSGDGVNLGSAPELRLQDFTIEAWIRRSHATMASQDPFQSGTLVGYGWNGYALAIRDEGRLFLTKVGVSAVMSSLAITDTEQFHHVAVTKVGSSVTFYLDGVGETVESYDPGFEFSSTAAIGARGGDWVASFLGAMDEVAIYNRALSPTEIQALYHAASDGKCYEIPPAITSPPGDAAVLVGDSALFTVAAAGTPPLSYQWLHNGTALEGATRAALTLGNVQPSQAGEYSVRVSNAFGEILSPVARLTVTMPPAVVRVLDTSVPGGRTARVPITMAGNGNENAVSFSLWFDPNLLGFREATVGSGATSASLIVNSNQAGSGRLGLTLVLSSGQTFAPGTNELLALDFAVAPVEVARTTILTFQDAPTLRQLVDDEANILPVNFSEGRVDIRATQFEGDAAPRPDGDRRVTLADWVHVGRLVARLDLANEGGEFERADCAPRSTLGDGEIKVTDWVQVGRYLAGLEPPTAAGGPTSPVSGVGLGLAGRGAPHLAAGDDGVTRTIRVLAGSVPAGQTNQVAVQLDALGDENALAFSLSFDPAKVRFVSAVAGVSAAGAAVNLNTRLASGGRIGMALARPTGATFPAGVHEVLQLWLASAANAAGEVPITLGDDPVPREVSDAAANALETKYLSGSLTVSVSGPVLDIARTPGGVVLSWPAAQGFVLQSSPALGAGANWIPDPVSTSVVQGREVAELPAAMEASYFRLARP